MNNKRNSRISQLVKDQFLTNQRTIHLINNLIDNVHKESTTIHMMHEHKSKQNKKVEKKQKTITISS